LRAAWALRAAEMDTSKLKDAFNLFDRDGDGLISRNELDSVLKSLGVNTTSEQEVRELVGEGQAGQFTARGGSIDFDFFCVLMGKKVKTLSNEDELKDAFRVLDKQGHGWITAKEMQLVCANLGEDMEEEEVDKMIAEAISNYDGKIYYDGFVKTMISRS